MRVRRPAWAVKVCSLAIVVAAFAVAPASASVAPSVASQYPLDVAISTATVYATVGSQGEETTFHVEYGTTTSYGTNAPVPDGNAGSDLEPQEVSVPLTGLAPGTTYHYRFVARNPGGTVEGQDETFTTFALSSAGVDTCPNAAYRNGPSANLPDCRAYEMVSPVDKNGAEVMARTFHPLNPPVIVDDAGNHAVFATRTGLGDTKGSGAGGYSQFMATRGVDGWTTKGITLTPALNDGPQVFFGSTSAFDFSSEYDRAVTTGYDLPGVTGAPRDTGNLYLEDTVGYKAIEAVTRFEGSEESFTFTPFSWTPELGGSSSDLGVITFQITNNLVPQAKGTSPKVYMLDHGVVRLVSVLPDGSLPTEAELVRERNGAIIFKDTVSSDGSRVYFEATPEGGAQQLYVRKNGSSTVLISESEASAPSEAQNVNFQAATPDGTHVVFSTATRLLDSDPGGLGTALYLYKDGPDPKSESNLTFIARFTEREEGRGTRSIGNSGTAMQVVLGLSDDASHIYFNSNYSEALPFKTVGEGLFLWDSGQIKQVAPEPGAREENAFEPYENVEAIASPDGHSLAFMNSRKLTKQASIGGPSGVREEIYLYDEEKETLKCVSCAQSGAGAVTGIELGPTATAETNPAYEINAHPRFFSDNGRYVFFSTSEALLPQDTNRLPDAYEYNVATGKLSLLSTGTGESGAWFVGASADGRDAFIVTRQRLNRWDPDKQDDLYDARIGSTLAEPPTPGTPCAGDACQGVPSAAPSFNTASEFTGLGNPPSGKPTVKAKARSLTRSQLLKRSLTACKKKPRRKRAACRAAARKRYASKQPAKRATRVGR